MATPAAAKAEKKKRSAPISEWSVIPRDKNSPPDDVEVFFDIRDRSYFYKVKGRYLSLGVSELKMHLRAAGLSDDSKRGPYFNGQLEIDWPIYNAQVNRAVDFAGSLAGHRVGAFTDGSGRQFLVTDEARGVFDPIPKKAAAVEFFSEFTAELLPGEQCSRFLYWLSIALRSLRAGDFQPAPVVVFAGPVECGKSLMQYIVTAILGGRAASPMRYMMEETTFNKDLAGCEHWMIEELKTTKDTRSRVAFGVALKECFNNQDFSIHGKGKDAITLKLFRRGTISVNDDPELLLHLPPLNSSVDDKMNLFQCSKVERAFDPFRDDHGRPSRAKIWAKVQEEVPAIRAWLLSAFKTVPKQWRNDRYGIAAYHDPNLRELLLSFAKEIRLLGIIDEILFSDPKEPGAVKTGRAMELEKEFRESKFNFEFMKCVSYPGEFASLLGKLAKMHPHRITKSVQSGYAHWSIHPPENIETKETK